MDGLSRFRWSRGLRGKSAAAGLQGLRVRIPQVAWILSLVNVVTCPIEVCARGRLLVHRSPIDCVCHWVWSRAKITICTSSVQIENVRLGRITSLYTSFVSLLLFFYFLFLECVMKITLLTSPLYQAMSFVWNNLFVQLRIGLHLYISITPTGTYYWLEDLKYIFGICK